MQKQQRDQNKGQKLETLIGIIKEAEQRRQALTPIQQPSFLCSILLINLYKYIIICEVKIINYIGYLNMSH